MIEWEQFNVYFDNKNARQPSSRLLIATTGRTGSHLLAHHLFLTGVLGAPFEYLHPKHFERWRQRAGGGNDAEVLSYIQGKRTNTSGWFSLKAHWHQLYEFERRLTKPHTEALDFNFAVHLKRKSVIRQAISMLIAQQSGSWIHYQPKIAEPEYSQSKIQGYIDSINRSNACWGDWFRRRSVPYKEFYYEDMIDNPAEMTQPLFKFLGLKHTEVFSESPVQTPKKQAGEINETWYKKYLNDTGQPILSRG